MSGCSGGNCSSGSCSDGSCSSGNDDRLPPGMLSRYDLNQDTGLGVLTWLDRTDGSLDPVSVSLLGRIRSSTDDRVFGMITGSAGIRPLYDAAFSYGIDTLYHIRCKEMEAFDASSYAKALADLAVRLNPMCIILPSTDNGNAIAERTGMIMGRQVHRDCTSFTIKDNLLTVEGSVSESIPMFSKRNIHPIIATIRSDGSVPVPDKGRKGTAISRPFKVE